VSMNHLIADYLPSKRLGSGRRQEACTTSEGTQAGTDLPPW
jgi:hypothetical protein